MPRRCSARQAQRLMPACTQRSGHRVWRPPGHSRLPEQPCEPEGEKMQPAVSPTRGNPTRLSRRERQGIKGGFMARGLLAGLLATGLLLVGAPAFAQPVNQTNVQKNLVETFVEALPTC